VIRGVLSERAGLGVPVDSLADEADLFAAGMTSHASVLEDAFGLEFPDRMLTREVFVSVSSIAAAIAELSEPENGGEPAAGSAV
jgi:acyl carrier protein